MLVEDLFEISQFESGTGFAMDLDVVDLRPALEQELESWRGTNPDHTYVLQAEDDWPRVYADEGRIIRQVMRNLLSNATTYSPDGGTITVTVTPVGRYVEVTVADEGIGMTPDELQQVFDKFWRADGSSTAVDGAGLGLVIAKYVLEQHGGHIWVESTPGEGTVVHFTLPQPEHEPTVLIIEDEEAVREIEQHILTSGGLATLVATNGQEAIEAAVTHRPDLILLDLIMPGMSGLEVLSALKDNPATAPIPVLVVSVRSGWQTIEETYRLGAADFLAKPFDRDELLIRVRRALTATAHPSAGRGTGYAPDIGR